MSMISTSKIFEALEYYKNLGYTMIDVPMCIDVTSSEHTKPKNVNDLYHSKDKVYVGSAEQSFIQLHKEGQLPDGKYMALTPCNRDEKVLDETHYLSFLKLELINVNQAVAKEMLLHAKDFFEIYLPTKIVTTKEAIDSYDLESKDSGIEIGSYGVRRMLDGTLYTYGTGIAEPRLSIVINKKNVL